MIVTEITAVCQVAANTCLPFIFVEAFQTRHGGDVVDTTARLRYLQGWTTTQTGQSRATYEIYTQLNQ